MREQGGYLWPGSDRVGATAILSHAARHFPAMVEHVPRRGVAIQAGGNVGVYPRHLSRYFTEVLTFEPDAENFACMEKNLAGISNVRAHRLALGASIGAVALKRHPDNAGAHRIDGPGSIDMTAIDLLELADCDLIWLDVEGYEPQVLAGAKRTLKRFRPVVILEDMALAADGEGAARQWLIEHLGYREKTRLLNDFVLVPE